VTIGTDGAIYVADWYDPVVGGHLMQDSTGFGRIYRVERKDKKMEAPSIDLNTTEGQMLAFKSPAINVRYAGFEKLKAKGDAVSLTDIPYERKSGLLLQLAQQSNDRWMLETIGRSAQGNESDLYARLKIAMKQDIPSTRWNEKMSSLAWRLHPVESVNDFAL